jgi:hypothetical protein
MTFDECKQKPTPSLSRRFRTAFMKLHNLSAASAAQARKIEAQQINTEAKIVLLEEALTKLN